MELLVQFVRAIAVSSLSAAFASQFPSPALCALGRGSVDGSGSDGRSDGKLQQSTHGKQSKLYVVLAAKYTGRPVRCGPGPVTGRRELRASRKQQFAIKAAKAVEREAISNSYSWCHFRPIRGTRLRRPGVVSREQRYSQCGEHQK